jgi:GNAT superfamily N-acetyltransferase
MLFADFALAQRLEGVEAAGGAAAAAAEALLRPDSGATSLAIAGGQAMFVGIGSSLTQAFGLGLRGPVSGAEMDELEHFFRSRGSPAFIETCPLADASLTLHFNRRGYHVVEYSHVLFRSVGPADSHRSAPDRVSVRRVVPSESSLWSRVVAEGFFGSEIPPGILTTFESLFRTEGAAAYLAWCGETAVGGGAMALLEGVTNCFGDATLAAHRGLGAQSALISVRLADAAAAGCELIMATTQCGSTSQRNYERFGFRVAYTRTKWVREWS